MIDERFKLIRRAEEVVRSSHCKYLQAQIDAMRALDELRRCSGEGIDRASDAYKKAAAAEREAKHEYEADLKLLGASEVVR